MKKLIADDQNTLLYRKKFEQTSFVIINANTKLSMQRGVVNPNFPEFRLSVLKINWLPSLFLRNVGKTRNLKFLQFFNIYKRPILGIKKKPLLDVKKPQSFQTKA